MAVGRQIFRNANIQYNLILRRVRVTVVSVEQVYVINVLWVSLCVCVCSITLVIQHETRMRRITMPCVS